MMKALSLTRPWDELILAGVKNVENRAWQPSRGYRGPLVVHAAKSYDPAAVRLLERFLHDGLLTPEQDEALDGCRLDRDAPTGYKGVVMLTGAHLDGDLECAGAPDQGDVCSLWAFARQWHWQVTAPVRFPVLIPGGGQLGLFATPSDVQAEAERAVAGILTG